MLKIHRITNTLFSSNTYVLYEEESPSAWLVDCGDVAPIIHWCEENRKIIEGVFLTHCHFDHIYGLNELYAYNPLLKVYTSSNGAVSLVSPRFNLSLYHERPFVYVGQCFILQDEDKLLLFAGVELRVIETLGHDWSCLSYFVGQYLFTGDSYIPDVRVVANFPKSNRRQAEASVHKLMEQAKEGFYICPGHENVLKVQR